MSAAPSLDRFRLDGRAAVVIGGAGGLGSAMARGLAEAGAAVAVADADAGQARRVAEAIGKAGGRARPAAVDVADRGSVERMADEVERALGPVEVLVNCAGVTHRSPAADFPEAEWHRVIAVNLTGVFHGCQVLGRRMLARRSGRIVNIASIAGKEGNPTLVPYSTAKAGVIGLTKALAKEVATRGILVNAVAPAVIGTELLKQMETSTVELLISKIPMGRVGTPEEVAALVAWLASDQCTFSTGAVYDLSGGRATY